MSFPEQPKFELPPIVPPAGVPEMAAQTTTPEEREAAVTLLNNFKIVADINVVQMKKLKTQREEGGNGGQGQGGEDGPSAPKPDHKIEEPDLQKEAKILKDGEILITHENRAKRLPATIAELADRLEHDAMRGHDEKAVVIVPDRVYKKVQEIDGATDFARDKNIAIVTPDGFARLAKSVAGNIEDEVWDMPRKERPDPLENQPARPPEDQKMPLGNSSVEQKPLYIK